MKGNSPRQKLGLRYERKVHRRLEEAFGLLYFPSIWLAYAEADGKVHYCQPDGLLFFEERKLCVITEVKYSHTADAYWQLENGYFPVVSRLLHRSGYRVATCEVVKWLDPHTRFPGPYRLRETLEDVQPGEFAVHILNRP